jgi:hypothetical protein
MSLEDPLDVGAKPAHGARHWITLVTCAFGRRWSGGAFRLKRRLGSPAQFGSQRGTFGL